MPLDPTQPPDEGRRRFLRDSVRIGAGLCAGTAALAGCGLLPEPEMRVCTLAELEAVPYLIHRFNGKQIFLTHREGEVVIFSLICRHRRCTVAYEEETALFRCPCHDGVYDQDGRVLEGPPPGPLWRYRHELRGEDVWVLNAFVKPEKAADAEE